MTEFGPDPAVLHALWAMLMVDGEFMRVSWSPGDGKPAELGPAASEEELLQRLVAEFDAEELLPSTAKVVCKGEPLPERAMVSYDFAAHDLDGWMWMVSRMCEDRDVMLAAVARRRPAFGTCDFSSVLWARVEGKAPARELARFRPSPTMVIREGSTSRRVALWALRKPLGFEWLDRANRRIAHKLFAPKKWTGAEFEFPCPGSCLRVGRARPVPVHVEWFDPAALFTAREVVGQLKEAPDPLAWRGDRRAAA